MSNRDFIAGYFAGMEASRKRASWGDFDDPVADKMNELYLPTYGDGDSMATQIATAVNKLVYRWFNDGDVFDNSMTGLEGWCNDISGSANWLYRYVPEVKSYLERAFRSIGANEYESILYDVFKATLCDEALMTRYSEQPKVGDAYSEDGPFEIVEWEEDEDEDYWDDEEDW